jgi:hypothetical protein
MQSLFFSYSREKRNRLVEKNRKMDNKINKSKLEWNREKIIISVTFQLA